MKNRRSLIIKKIKKLKRNNCRVSISVQYTCSRNKCIFTNAIFFKLIFYLNIVNQRGNL